MARRAPTRGAIACAGILLSSILSAAPGAAQSSEGWNSQRVLELVERARERRQQAALDPDLKSYAAEVRGYLYFLLDRRDADERMLVKVDQVALDVFWRAPGIMTQRIVGLRDAKKLPTNIRYHLDHLTLVQDNFGDLIRMGDGDEVQGVTHPTAPGSEQIYNFRLGDSITVTLPGALDPVRVYEVQVRPQDDRMPAFVGSVFLDRETAAIVRMDFTFTPSAYVDRQLDYIQISLENGLWEGKYWLPHEQRAELRRQFPQLDFPVGGVIRGRYSVRNYRFNEDIPSGTPIGSGVTALPQEVRERFPFEQELYAQLEEEGLRPPADLAEIRRRAMELMDFQNLSGLGRLRAAVPNASAGFRYNRAEGVFAGTGVTWSQRPDLRLRANGGYAFAAAMPEVTLRLEQDQAVGRLSLTVTAHELRDIGPVPGAPGVWNTLSTLAGGEDYLDPYFVSGATLSQELEVGPLARLTFALRLEEHEAAALEVAHAPLNRDARFREVRSIDEGNLRAMTLTLERLAPPGLSAFGVSGEARLTSGAFDGAAFARGEGALLWKRQSYETERELSLEVRVGTNLGDSPKQMRFLLGGRETLPGYAYRSFSGDRLALARLEGSTPLYSPLVRGRAFAAAGYAGPRGAAMVDDGGLGGTGSVRTSVGVGLGLGFDILRVDVARGLNSGEWQLLFSVNRSFWAWL
ncbi:MAG: hypothetical protein HY701_10315 [Gemmatimonadetes bacterium]|nr:hypothetical protein [Gemmatimonadota bacterium]